MGAVLYTADARLVCPICYTKADVLASRRRREAFDRGGAALAGAIAAVIPFLAAADGAGRPGWTALGAGVVAVVCSGSTILAARARASAGWLALGALMLLLGAYHLARGAGLVA